MARKLAKAGTNPREADEFIGQKVEPAEPEPDTAAEPTIRLNPDKLNPTEPDRPSRLRQRKPI